MIKCLYQCTSMINREVHSTYGPLLSLDEQLYRILQLQIFYAILDLATYGGGVRSIHHIQAFFLYRTRTTVYKYVYNLREFILTYVYTYMYLTIWSSMYICFYIIYLNMHRYKDTFILIHIYILNLHVCIYKHIQDCAFDDNKHLRCTGLLCVRAWSIGQYCSGYFADLPWVSMSYEPNHR